MRISDWSSDVCSSDLPDAQPRHHHGQRRGDKHARYHHPTGGAKALGRVDMRWIDRPDARERIDEDREDRPQENDEVGRQVTDSEPEDGDRNRSEEHTSELQSLMRISYTVFCLKKKQQHDNQYFNSYKKTTHTTTKYLT